MTCRNIEFREGKNIMLLFEQGKKKTVLEKIFNPLMIVEGERDENISLFLDQ